MSTPPRPRALLFSHLCNPEHMTGAEKMLLFITLELERLYECTLVVPVEGLLAKEARHHGVTTVVRPYPLLYEMYNPVPALPSLFHGMLGGPEFGSLLDFLLLHEPDVVITNTCVNILPAAAANKLGIPVAWIIAESIFENGFAPLSALLIDQYSDWLVGISQTTLAPFQTIGGEDKKFVLPPSWRTEDYDAAGWHLKRYKRRIELGIYDERPVIGYISADIYENKGLNHFIQMAVSVCETNRDAHFLIIGKQVDPIFMDSCLQLITSSGHSSRFSILTFDPDIESLYTAMNVVVVPSLVNEGFGLTALEGLIFGKPVVAYRSGGLNEILTSTGNDAFLAHRGDVQDLTAKVQLLLSVPYIRQVVGERNMEAASRVFGIDAYRSRLKQFLNRIESRMDTRAIALQNAARFPEGSLVKGEASNTVFLIEQGKKRPFASAEAFRCYNGDWSRVVVVHDAQLVAHPTGESVETEASLLQQNAPFNGATEGSALVAYAADTPAVAGQSDSGKARSSKRKKKVKRKTNKAKKQSKRRFKVSKRGGNGKSRKAAVFKKKRGRVKKRKG